MNDRYFIINKPYNMVSQFISTHNVGLLGDLDFDFPAGTHAIGRLDSCSEGLLILTTNKKVTRLLFQGDIPHKRTYLVQVKHEVSPESLLMLQSGVIFPIKGGENYKSIPCDVSIVANPEYVFKNGYELPEQLRYTWLSITLTEGKYHQVRKMVNAVRHRCIRLIRVSIEDLLLGDLKPGGVREIDEEVFFKKLNI